MIKEIQARVLLSHVKQPHDWFGLKYNMNLYRGCQHRCVYCDSRSTCHQIDSFDTQVLIKGNVIELLRRELAGKRVKGTVGTGSINDPYLPPEASANLTGRALDAIAEFPFPMHVMTKSNLLLRDLDTLCHIDRVYAAVSFTITTTDDELGRKLEPGAPLVSERLRAMMDGTVDIPLVDHADKAADQCPYFHDAVQQTLDTAQKMGAKDRRTVELQSLQEVQDLAPSPYGTFSIVYDGALLAHPPVGAK
jgi:hypothetical protein